VPSLNLGVVASSYTEVALEMIYDSQVSFATTSTSPTGPTIPNTVDNTCIGLLMEYCSSLSSIVTPSGWTFFFTQPATYTSGAGIAIYYKVLSTSDRNVSVGGIVGGSQRDQLLVFKNNKNNAIQSITQGNFTGSSVSGSLSANAPSIAAGQSAVVVHYYYNSSTSTPTVSMTPTADAIVRSTVNNFHGSQYKIYNPGSSPINTSSSATLAGTIAQGLFWLIMN
jgi:hypothetical protein